MFGNIYNIPCLFPRNFQPDVQCLSTSSPRTSNCGSKKRNYTQTAICLLVLLCKHATHALLRSDVDAESSLSCRLLMPIKAGFLFVSSSISGSLPSSLSTGPIFIHISYPLFTYPLLRTHRSTRPFSTSSLASQAFVYEPRGA